MRIDNFSNKYMILIVSKKYSDTFAKYFFKNFKS
jgi:hypothetical protein